jgi:hypothetical protein
MRKRSVIHLLVILRSAHDETPGLNDLVNVLYAEYKIVNTSIWTYSRHDDALPPDIEKMMKSGYVFAVIPNPDRWRDLDTQRCVELLESTAKKYGCEIDAALLRPNGMPVFIAKGAERDQ